MRQKETPVLQVDALPTMETPMFISPGLSGLHPHIGVGKGGELHPNRSILGSIRRSGYGRIWHRDFTGPRIGKGQQVIVKWAIPILGLFSCAEDQVSQTPSPLVPLRVLRFSLKWRFQSACLVQLGHPQDPSLGFCLGAHF